VRSSVVLIGSNEGLSTVDELEGRHVVETGALIMQRSRIIADKMDKSACAIVGVTYTLSDGHMRVQGTVGDIGSI
jgi:carbonic anhydrase